ncbi:Methyltransferase domain-containing protein [Actinacidiphila rubida]|uniref:Methyltransferase domain-containing protein n=1 Tax=Actinacidiphila rubida TaxID=310780 RepID=A0A1H8Q841_9ACTN|nr:class I SAM-dependent methyltransferase [Actinacidiphila rubida]SEO50067.1 Methyltransferase domain-containing protein [Actinacidiphila rubida]
MSSSPEEAVSAEEPVSAEEYWDGRYGTDRVWSGRPNAALVREVAGLVPGTVLDLGCGEGADAVWLAQQGWHVTAVDVSRVALDRAAAHAEEAGVPDGRITWERHNLADSFPTGRYDLVSTHFLHSPVEIPRERILRAAADAVAPGGVLLIVGHADLPPWAPTPDHEVGFPSATEVHRDLALPDASWDVLVAAAVDRPATAPDGTPAHLTDSILKLRRHA